ncbi:hypothetical protein GCM10023183_37490 [Nibribacter koreensis]|uniref:Uncharacterized protein n=1 Tax=Nibribacter koreensis TaxID=1084519 RepID=A0ABP8G3K2_9BACT
MIAVFELFIAISVLPSKTLSLIKLTLIRVDLIGPEIDSRATNTKLPLLTAIGFDNQTESIKTFRISWCERSTILTGALFAKDFKVILEKLLFCKSDTIRYSYLFDTES